MEGEFRQSVPEFVYSGVESRTETPEVKQCWGMLSARMEKP